MFVYLYSPSVLNNNPSFIIISNQSLAGLRSSHDLLAWRRNETDVLKAASSLSGGGDARRKKQRTV